MKKSAVLSFCSRVLSSWILLLPVLLISTGCSPIGVTGTANTSTGSTTTTAAVTITGVTPNNGAQTASTPIAITGTNFAGTVTVSIGGVAATNVVVSGGGTQITALAQPSSTAGLKSVTVSSSTNGSATLQNAFRYNATPTFTSVTPNVGPDAGGNTVIIDGGNFAGNVTVTFGGLPATSVFINSGGTRLSCVVPAASSPGLTAVPIVISSDSNGAVSTASAYTYQPAPTISNINPATGSVVGGTSVTITGTNFGGTVTVNFGTAPALVTSSSSTQVVVSSPAAAAAGAVTVTVISTTNGTAISSSGFTYTGGSSGGNGIDSVTPNQGPASGGTTVVIAGTGFGTSPSVLFGTTAATGVSVNTGGTQITCVTPAGTAGAVNVSVNTGTTTLTLNDGYTYNPAVTFTSVSPNNGPLGGGNTVVLNGSNFGGTVSVSFGNVAATGISVGSGGSTVSAVVPAATSAGAVSVSVRSTLNGSVSLSNGYSYNPAATITSVSPTPFAGPLAGGTSVTLVGTNLGTSVSVSVGSNPVSSPVVTGGTMITFSTPPASTPGPVTISLFSTTFGSLNVSTQFTYNAPPAITGVTPTVGGLGGGTALTITGSNFQGVTSVLAGTSACTGVSVNGSFNTINCTTSSASAAGTVNVVVQSPNGTATAVNAFTYTTATVATSINPTSGPQQGGTTVTIAGANFTGVTGVTVGGVALTNVNINAGGTQITGVTGNSSTSGLVSVVVTTSNNGTATLNNQFTYNPSPTITALNPTSGPQQGGTTVILTGTNFQNVTSVSFGQLAGTVTNVSSTQVTVISPAAASAGVVTVTLVSTSNGTATFSAPGFTYNAALTVAANGLNPTSGSQFGGTAVTITGTNFATPVSVNFGGTAAASVTVNSSTSIVAVTPARAAGTVDVNLSSTVNGTATVANGFTFTASFAGPTQSSIIAMDAAEQRLVAANPENNTVSVFNIAGNALSRLAEISVGNEPRSVAVTPDGKKCFVANAVDGTISVVNLVTLSVSNTIDLSVSGEREPVGVVVSPNGTRVYAADSTSNSVAVINAQTEAFVTSVNVGASGIHPRALAMSNDRDGVDSDELLYVTMFFAQLRPSHTGLDAGQDDQREGRVAVIDGTNTVTSTVILAPIVGGVSATSGTGFPSNGSVLSLVNTVNGTGTTVGPAPANPAPSTGTFATGCYPNQLAAVSLNPTTGRVYVVSTGASPNGPVRFDVNVQGLVSLIDPSTLTETTGTGTLANVFNKAPLNLNQGVGNSTNPVKIFHSNPVAMAWRPDGAEAWVLIQNSDVMVRLITDGSGIPTINAPLLAGGGPIRQLDLQTASIPGKAPQGIVINSSNQAYVYNFVSRTVTQVSLTATPSVVQTAVSAALPVAGSQAATVHLGEELFYTGRGRLSRGGWGACIACHPDGRTDNVTWMFDAGPRKTIPLDGSFSKTNPTDQRVLNYSSVRDEVQDFELNTRGVSGGAGLIAQDRQVYILGGETGSVTSSAISVFDAAAVTLNTTSAQVSGNPAIPPLATGLTAFATATLPDGRIMTVGGKDPSGNVTSGVQLFDPSTNTIRSVQALISGARFSLGAAAVNTTLGPRVYAFGGYDATGNPTTTTAEFNPTTGTWRAMSSLPAAIAEFGTAVVFGNNVANPADRIYTVGGSDTAAASANVTSTVFQFAPDPVTTGAWVTFNVTLSTPRRACGAAGLLRGATPSVFVFGGFTTANAVTQAVESFTTLGTPVSTINLTSLPTGLRSFGYGTFSNTAIVVGGLDGSSNVTTTIQVFNPSIAGAGSGGVSGAPSGTWTAQAVSLPAGLANAGVSSPPPVNNLFPVGNTFRDPRQDAITAWVATIRPNVALNAEPAGGRVLFTQVGLTAPGVSCATCHGGSKWTRSRVDYIPSPSTSLAFGHEQVKGAELLFTLSQPGSIPVGATFQNAVEIDVGTFLSTSLNEVRGDPGDPSRILTAVGGGAPGFNIPSLFSMHSQPPYFHNGSVETLSALLAGGGAGFGASAFKSVHSVPLANQALMLQFLQAIDPKLTPVP